MDLYTFTYLPWTARIEAVLDAQLPAGTSLKVDLRGLLRADTATRYQTYATAIDKGILTVDEVRDLEDLPPLFELPETGGCRVIELADGDCAASTCPKGCVEGICAPYDETTFLAGDGSGERILRGAFRKSRQGTAGPSETVPQPRPRARRHRVRAADLGPPSRRAVGVVQTGRRPPVTTRFATNSNRVCSPTCRWG